ncbi:response regulator, partial [bacterium]|nr:response regulator [bacterium]
GGREGVQIAKIKHPDIILLDMMMPRFNGIETCKVLKKFSETKDIPVIFLTANTDKKNVVAAIEAGGRDYMAKPFSPSAMLKRIQALTAEEDPSQKATSVIVEDELPDSLKAEIEGKVESESVPPFRLDKKDDVMAIEVTIPEMSMNNYKLYRNLFNDMINEGMSKIALDIRAVKRIDGSGLGLLISLEKTLENYGGELRITHPTNELNHRFSFINLNYIFRTYDDLEEASASFKTTKPVISATTSQKSHIVCLSCTYVNPANFHYCGHCGADLIIGESDKVLQVLREKISSKVFSDAGTDNIDDLNSSRDLKPEDNPTPREFDVEIKSKTITILYKGALVEDKDLQELEQITIRPPKISGRSVPLNPGTILLLRSTHKGSRSVFKSKVKDYDEEKSTMNVHYTQEAKIIHSEKTFSVKTPSSIPVKIIDPTASSSEDNYEGSITELSRVGMEVYALDDIPIKKCLAVKFNLPDGTEISTPFFVAEPGEKDFLYDIEFIVIDEKERSNIIQFMYQCQIEEKKRSSNLAD